MLRPPRAVRGLTLLELAVAMALFAMLVMAGVPGIGEWLQNERTRSAAQTILQGVMRARAEAVAQNARVRFQLTSSLGGDCVLDAAGRHWVLTLDRADPDQIEHRCGEPPSARAEPYIVDRASLASERVQVVASTPTLAFNGLGLPVNVTTEQSIDVSASGAACDRATGALCLRIAVSPLGNVRLCNPNLGADHASDPRAC